MTAVLADAFVFFGATGDLAFKQIFPALAGLIRDEDFDLPIIGVARSGDLDALRARARASLAASRSAPGPLATQAMRPDCLMISAAVPCAKSSP